MYTIKCKNCGQANKITNIRCEFCNVELNHDAISKAREKVIKSRDKKAKNISKNQVGKVKTIVFFLFFDIMFHFVLLSNTFHGINRHFNS